MYYLTLGVCKIWYKIWHNFIYRLDNFEYFNSNFLDFTKMGLTWLFH